jgi:inorganic pyrophosphatase
MSYEDVYPHILKEITHFFSIYKDLEGKSVQVNGWKSAAEAKEIIVKAQKAFKSKE